MQNTGVVLRVEVKRDLLRWARERAGLDMEALAEKFPKLPEWEAGESQPTLNQLERFARATHTSVGFLFLERPPDEPLPIPDFRTMRSGEITKASPDLLDTIYQCEQRQDWYRRFAISGGDSPPTFVGSLSTSTDIVTAAERMGEVLGFNFAERGPSWNKARAALIERAEAAGVLVMINGVVGSNTHRKLDPEEFRGFALVDEYAPLVFVNGKDTLAAQIFTLAHELAHIWVGESALSDAEIESPPVYLAERWCNEVAAEFLVPMVQLRRDFRQAANLTDELNRLAARFRVSTLVVLRRIYDADYMGEDEFHAAFAAERRRVLDIPTREGTDGNFYNTLPVRVSRTFAQALIVSTLEGRTLHRDAFRMLGFKKLSTFHELSRRLGVA